MIADMHCDTLGTIRFLRKEGKAAELRGSDNLCVDLEKMKKGGYALQNFAVFVDMEECADPHEDALELIRIFDEELAKNRDVIRQVRDVSEIEACLRDGFPGAMLTLEEGGVCKGKPEYLHEFYERGARMMTLTWNYENELGRPAALSPASEYRPGAVREYGLTRTGFAFLEEMEHIGMIIDVSHLSDDGFFDVFENTKKPFVASHSNARRLCGHSRNLTDGMLRMLGERGGVAGINFCSEFLGEPGEDCRAAIAAHARHMVDMAGRESVGLGSDFDGCCLGNYPRDARDLDDLAWILERGGLGGAEIEGILYKNVLRLYREVL